MNEPRPTTISARPRGLLRRTLLRNCRCQLLFPYSPTQQSRSNCVLSPARLRLLYELPSPTLNRLGEQAERAPAAGQLVAHAHGRPRLDVTHEQPAGFQILQPSRQDLVPGTLRALRELAEPQGAHLQDIEDQRIPGATQDLDRSLEGLALGIHRLRHGPESSTIASQKKAP